MDSSTNFITTNQQQMLNAFARASGGEKMVAVVDHHGSGFKFAVKKYIHTTSFTKVTFVKIEYGIHARDISISLMKPFMNIKFVTKGYKTTQFTKLIYDLSLQVKQNLKGRRILVIIDNFDRVNTVHTLSRFFAILRGIQFKCGIILRTNMKHYETIASLDEKLLTDLMQMTKEKVVLKRNTPEDIKSLCRVYGLRKPEIVEEISKKTLSFTIAMDYINKYLQYSPVVQLELDLFPDHF